MKSFSWTRGAVVAASVVASAAAQANSYKLVDIGRAVDAGKINDRGEVAGWTQEHRGLLWTGDHWHKLAKGEGYALDINANGDVVGEIAEGAPTLWRWHQPPVELPVPQGTDGKAHGINDAGAVVGLYYPPTGPGRCFLWTQDAGPVDLGQMDPSGSQCEAEAINSLGQVTGNADAKGDKWHAFRWQDGKFEDLGIIAGGRLSTGYAINSAGDIAGWSSVDPWDGKHIHAVVWRGEQLVDLSDSDYVMTEALDLNDAGDIVGFAMNNNKYWAVRFTDPGVVRLDTEVTNLGRWQLYQALGVNPRGDIVVYAVGPDGNPHTVILQLESRD